MRLLVLWCLAAAPTVSLRGTAVAIPKPAPSALVTGELVSIAESLDAGGWTLELDAGVAVASAADASVTLESGGQSDAGAIWWARSRRPLDGFENAIAQGVAQHRMMTTTANERLEWIEVRYGPGDAERLGPPPPPLPDAGFVSAEIFSRGDPSEKRIALTFDGCSTLDRSRYDVKVIDALIAQKAEATLFLSGHWAETHSDETRALAAQPLFEIGNHSFAHPHMPEVSRARMHEELAWTQRVLFGLTGRFPSLFRPPFGEVDDAVAQEAARLGLRTIQYDFPSGDPDPSFTAPVLERWVLQKARNGSIVVMHMNGRGWHTAEALPAIIRGLRAKGFTLVKVSTLLQPAVADGGSP